MPRKFPKKEGSVELKDSRGAKKRRPGKRSVDLAVKRHINSFLSIIID